ncbi:hypothetical protein EDC94DRAFT_613644 [Helicostylum pulchrum]|nr:hypothetical protein EDC94DRAFT_613644 [Helicostylum pulchrum]
MYKSFAYIVCYKVIINNHSFFLETMLKKSVIKSRVEPATKRIKLTLLIIACHVYFTVEYFSSVYSR